MRSSGLAAAARRSDAGSTQIRDPGQSPSLGLQTRSDRTEGRSAPPGWFPLRASAITGRRKDGFDSPCHRRDDPVRLAEDGNDLRHLASGNAPFLSVSVAPHDLRLVLLPSVGVRPDLDGIRGAAHVGCRRRPGDRASHPKPPFPIGPPPRALAIVVRPTRHRRPSVRGLRRGGNRSPETPVARTAPPAARRLRRLSTRVVM